MNATTIKKIDKSKNKGLTKNKKELLKKHMGSASSKIDMNDVHHWWKYENH
ncbi:hypothetical protein PNH38_07300 [Anoxybacillus rupiensis]|uniref:Uncharacterized protein n=1 Tax=Anoxybacteroides rupiense TaxID=311460 RepID=A0ABT5W2Y7_9BACL|nr:MULTISPECIES: hypothetical protein [Anoxybacillus]MBS2772766.1 hypothetical protein [Anoxybacillus rupiensis]MDE8563690.1 hypothetical protein [Anoxybacillus rupiensis]QHC04465.1 hypothetical protein GRQ40_11200 [Anoxybacillus sp. PDR2]